MQLRSLHNNSKKLWQYCPGDMMVKGGYFLRVGGNGSEDGYSMKQE
jgi:hypothetical protein